MAGAIRLFKTRSFSLSFGSKTISLSFLRLSEPSSLIISAPNSEARIFNRGLPTSTISLATLSASTTGTPKDANSDAIEDLPQAIPPVSPTTKGFF